MRKTYRRVILDKLQSCDWGWLARSALTYGQLKWESIRPEGKAPGPLMATLILTENCNLRCPMCDIPSRYLHNPAERDGSVWRQVIDELYEIGTMGIGFTGGEVTIREDIFDLIAHARGYRMPVTLNTNALLLTERRYPALLSADPTNINISIDSGESEVNDKLRGGKRVLERTLARIESLAELRQREGARYTLTVVCVLSDLNIGHLEKLFSIVAASGADRIGIMPLHNIDRHNCRVARFTSVPENLADELFQLSKRYHLPLENSPAYLADLSPVMASQGGMPITCNAGYTSITIGPDLQLYRCWPFYQKQNPLRQYQTGVNRLAEIWNDHNYRQDRLTSLACRECFWNCHAELNYLIRM